MTKFFKVTGLTVFFVLTLATLVFSQQNEQITITTYYPSPYGVYNVLRLYPHGPDPATTPCDSTNDEGAMYYDNVQPTHTLMVCRCDNAGACGWQSVSGGIGGGVLTDEYVADSPQTTGPLPMIKANEGHCWQTQVQGSLSLKLTAVPVGVTGPYTININCHTEIQGEYWVLTRVCWVLMLIRGTWQWIDCPPDPIPGATSPYPPLICSARCLRY